MLASLLALGFLLGLKHALDVDHVAAVASLATRATGVRETVRVAGAWGLGHAAALVAFGAALVIVGVAIPPAVADLLEGAVGIMLMLLGADVLRRVRHKRVHAHPHVHDGVTHIHVHIHDDNDRHDDARVGHAHAHARSLIGRALLVGGVHGLSGTAALILLAIPAVHSAQRAVIYLLVFGGGTILGMMLFSLLISVPLASSVRRLRWGAYTVDGLVGVANLALGAWIAYASLS